LEMKSGRLRDFIYFGSRIYGGKSLRTRNCLYVILRDFGVSHSQPTLVYQDNLVCITMSINPVRCKYSRHIDTLRHYIPEVCLSGVVNDEVKLIPLHTHHMLDDVMTRSLPATGLARHHSVVSDDVREANDVSFTGCSTVFTGTFSTV